MAEPGQVPHFFILTDVEQWCSSVLKEPVEVGVGDETVLSGAMTISRDAKGWPDFLFLDARRGVQVVSARVREWAAANCDDVPCHPVKVVSKNSTRGRRPRYWYLAPRAGLDVTELEVRGIRIFQPVPDSWSGQPLFVPRGRCRSTVMCSEAFIDAAVKERWSNVAFRAIDLAPFPHYGWRGIKLTKNWRKTMYPPALDPNEIGARIEDLRETGPKGARRWQAGLFLVAVGPAAVEPVVRAFEGAEDGSKWKFELAVVMCRMHEEGRPVAGEDVERASAYIERFEGE